MSKEAKSISASEAQNNFSQVADIAEREGKAVILEDGRPKFILISVDGPSFFELTDDEKIDVVAARVLRRFRPAFEELAR